MTDGASSIWREDEGQQTEQTRISPAPSANLFGPATTPEHAPSQPEQVNLWRSDEGKPTVQMPSHTLVSPSEGRRKRPRRAERRSLISWRVVVVTVLGLLLLALVVDAGSALMTIRNGIERVATELDKVERRLGEGDPEGARVAAEEALDEARSAQAAAARPSLSLASYVPEVKREVEALDGAVEAAGLSAEAASSIISGASSLGLDEEGVPQNLYVDGQLQLDTITSARGSVNDAEFALTLALVRLEDLDPRLHELRTPIADAHARIRSALTRVTDGRVLMDLLPPLFGATEERRYLLAFQALGEARATGGLIGFVGTLSAEDGRLTLDEIGPGQDFFQDSYRDLQAPAWFRDSYSSQGALRQWQQANVSPNHEAVADVLLKMYEQTNGESLDGVVMMDPLAMGYMMPGLDPIAVQGRTIDESNVVDAILHDSYIELTPDEQNIFLSKLVEEFWDEIGSANVDFKRFADGLGEAIRSQHFKLYSRRSPDARRIQALDLDGHYEVGANSQMVFNVNYAANKVDYFLHRELETEIELEASGDAQVTTAMTLENRAPEGPASPLLGLDNGLDPGVNRMTINMLMPPSSAVGSFSVGGEERSPFSYVDEDSPVVWDLLEIPPGESETVSLTYTIPGPLPVLDGSNVFDFSLYPQATVNSDRFSLSIAPPAGMEVVDTEGGLSDDEVPSRSGTLDEPVSVRVFIEES